VPITPKQVERLLTPVRPDRIEKVRGLSYVPQYEARAELSRVFGFGNWDSEIHDMQLMYEDQEDRNGKTYWKVAYRCACTLTIRDYEGNLVCRHTEWHAEESAPQPSRGEAHALALTSVESYALRRACLNLGDAFGLHLYRDGQLSPLIKGSLQTTDPESPLYAPSATPPPATGPLTDEQRATLAASLGAVEIPQEPAGGVSHGDAAGNERVSA
jgi:hypothetical protein